MLECYPIAKHENVDLNDVPARGGNPVREHSPHAPAVPCRHIPGGVRGALPGTPIKNLAANVCVFSRAVVS